MEQAKFNLGDSVQVNTIVHVHGKIGARTRSSSSSGFSSSSNWMYEINGKWYMERFLENVPWFPMYQIGEKVTCEEDCPKCAKNHSLTPDIVKDVYFFKEENDYRYILEAVLKCSLIRIC